LQNRIDMSGNQMIQCRAFAIKKAS
jgi:hypothetical protein